MSSENEETQSSLSVSVETCTEFLHGFEDILSLYNLLVFISFYYVALRRVRLFMSSKNKILSLVDSVE